MAWLQTPARIANDLQKTIALKIKLAKTDDRAIYGLARAWIDFEVLKRELRGIPRLSTITLAELRREARDRAKEITNVASFTELDETKESIHEPTVTAPPTPDAP